LPISDDRVEKFPEVRLLVVLITASPKTNSVREEGVHDPINHDQQRTTSNSFHRGAGVANNTEASEFIRRRP
jgi:hypothetical protein